jgi:hypothetical protein
VLLGLLALSRPLAAEIQTHVKVFNGQCTNYSHQSLKFTSETGTTEIQACSDACLDNPEAKGFTIAQLPSSGACWCDTGDSATCKRSTGKGALLSAPV